MDALGEGDDIGSHRGKFLAASNGDDWPRAIRLYLEATIRFARDDDAMAPERVEELHQFYDKGTVTGRERAKATARELREGGLRSRLWDGLKRVFAWVRKALAEAVESAKKLLKVARRIAAYAFQVASEAVSWVYDAVKRFTTHVKAAVDRHHRDDDGHVVVICSFGRDTDLFVSSAAPLGYARNYTERLHLSAQIFRQACRILGTLVGFALRLVTGALTVAALLQTLVFALTRASGLRDAFREIARLELRYRLLEREANIGA